VRGNGTACANCASVNDNDDANGLSVNDITRSMSKASRENQKAEGCGPQMGVAKWAIRARESAAQRFPARGAGPEPASRADAWHVF
jgi:hypothetical protein